MDRRNFLKLITATGVGAAVGCDTRTSEKLISYIRQPEGLTPGVATYYATTCLECQAGCGVLARTREGRVVKLEGNPHHPLSRGALCARGQAALQGLYNPDRLREPLIRDGEDRFRPISWAEALEKINDEIRNRIDKGRNGKICFLTGEISDSDADLIDWLSNTLGFHQPVNLRLEPETRLASAAERIFEHSGMPELHVDKATLLVSVGADFLETWGKPVSQAMGFTSMHAYSEGAKGKAVYIGPRQSNTAAACDQWVKLAPGREAAALRVIAEGFLRKYNGEQTNEFFMARTALESLDINDASEAVGQPIDELLSVGEAIASAETPLVIASGSGQDSDLALSLAFLLTHLSGGSERTLRFPENARLPRGNGIHETLSLFKEVDGGEVEVLFVHNANPAFIFPNGSKQMTSAEFIIYLGTQHDETAESADIVLPLNHPLESWGYHYPSAGILGTIQPAMRPVFEKTVDFADLIAAIAKPLLNNSGTRIDWTGGRDFVEIYLNEEIQSRPIDESETITINDVKRIGGLFTPASYSEQKLKDKIHLPNLPKPESGLLTWLFPHPYFHAGRSADKPWLQEAPETSTSAAWWTWAEINPTTAEQLGAEQGDAVAVSLNGREIEVPVLITPQTMPGVVSIPIGQGHEVMGRWAARRGVNPLKLVNNNLELSGFAVDSRIVKGGGKDLTLCAASQDQGRRQLARSVALSSAAKPTDEKHHPDESLYPEVDHPEYDWGMVIDLDKCTGCGACVVACYAENNIPVVEMDQVKMGREMSWIRIEKYFDPDSLDDVRLLPVLCQHCRHAPCEPVCPVHASYHTPEGLNAQVYNRCVGTRYCANNCPYKVRRFNYFDHKREQPLDLQLNPDVTVRERGVMEKCTFCVQRIKEKREIAKNENRLITEEDGLVPACAQTCPTRAIAFGNLNDPESRVRRLSEDPRSYRLLEELGTRPSVFYLKKVLRDNRT